MTTTTNAEERRSEVWQRAHAVYDTQFRHLEAEHKGKFLVLDLNSKDYEVDEDHIQASRRMLARHPVEGERAFYAFRIGYPTAY